MESSDLCYQQNRLRQEEPKMTGVRRTRCCPGSPAARSSSMTSADHTPRALTMSPTGVADLVTEIILHALDGYLND